MPLRRWTARITPMRALLAAVLGLLFVVVGLVAYVGDQTLQADAAGWQTAPGRVTAAAVGRKARRGVDDYEPRVTYAYAVDGREYAADRIWLTDARSWRAAADAERFLAAYPVGAAVDVRYDPRNPARAALLTGRSGSSQWLFVAFFGLALAVAGLLVRRRQLRRGPPRG